MTINTDPRPPETDDFDKRVIDVAALAIHRWKHPTVDLDFCSCRKDAEIAFEILETEAAGQWR